jgi:hypothetical protein
MFFAVVWLPVECLASVEYSLPRQQGPGAVAPVQVDLFEKLGTPWAALEHMTLGHVLVAFHTELQEQGQAMDGSSLEHSLLNQLCHAVALMLEAQHLRS